MSSDTIKQFIISVYAENQIGLAGRLMQIFTRRKINIDSLTTSESEIEGIYRFTIVIHVSQEQVIKVVNQVKKIVDVMVAFYFNENEVVFQEIALYKIKSSTLLGSNVEKVVRKSAARILYVDQEFTVIEKTGHKEETQELFDKLKPFGILEFVRSGRVAIARPMPSLHSWLEEVGLTDKFVVNSKN
jgi:acetolactate synthase-1/3 small subunit